MNEILPHRDNQGTSNVIPFPCNETVKPKTFRESYGLTKCESNVAELVAQGLSNEEVAKRLFVTEKTVKFHNTNIFKKMMIKSRAQLIVQHMRFNNKANAA